MNPMPATMALEDELVQGLRRLKLRSIRQLAPELCITARTQRWRPEEFLRVLVSAECAARDESNRELRLRTAAFPVRKTLDEFDLSASTLSRDTFAYLASLEWISTHRNLAFVGPPGTGKSHLSVALGRAAVDAGFRVRFFRADLLVEALYRGLADNSVGRVIDAILRRSDLVICDELGFSPLDSIAANHLFRFVATAYETRSLVLTSNWPFEQWTNFLPDATSATAILDRFLHHADVVVLGGESYRLREARAHPPRIGRSAHPETARHQSAEQA
ncbi:MAG: IS21-like element helper ATPase IstB [Mycobacterium sp.]